MTELVCEKFNADLCRSCTLLDTPYAEQLRQKQVLCETLLDRFFAPDAAPGWLEPQPSPVAGFRNRAKFVVNGSLGDVVLGIINHRGDAVDLTDCPIQNQAVNSTGAVLQQFLSRLKIAPYVVAERRGELKFVHVTAAPDGALLVRFVVRSMQGAKILHAAVSELRRLLPNCQLATVNLLPEHRAVLEGDTEIVLWGSTLPLQLGEISLNLLPQSFLQTNIPVASALYLQAQWWADQCQPKAIWDLYSGVGGFALHLAGPAREVLGVEISELAVRAARQSAREQLHAARPRFIAADATEFALQSARSAHPDFLVVNPPRRGCGPELCEWIENSATEYVLYSSCNPGSLAQDLERLPSLKICEARVFDMFPHTRHVEVAVLLQRQ